MGTQDFSDDKYYRGSWRMWNEGHLTQLFIGMPPIMAAIDRVRREVS